MPSFDQAKGGGEEKKMKDEKNTLENGRKIQTDKLFS
jgi:hypothetical protein